MTNEQFKQWLKKWTIRATLGGLIAWAIWGMYTLNVFTNVAEETDIFKICINIGENCKYVYSLSVN